MTNNTKLIQKLNKAWRRMIQLETKQSMIRHYNLLVLVENFESNKGAKDGEEQRTQLVQSHGKRVSV